MAAGLNDANAVLFADAFCTANGITDATAKTHWESLAKLLYAHLKTDIEVIIASLSIVTTGTALTQTGPAAPIPLTPV
jgi:hypothetical protein